MTRSFIEYGVRFINKTTPKSDGVLYRVKLKYNWNKKRIKKMIVTATRDDKVICQETFDHSIFMTSFLIDLSNCILSRHKRISNDTFCSINNNTLKILYNTDTAKFISKKY